MFSNIESVLMVLKFRHDRVTLYPHQVNGSEWLRLGSFGILAAEMGTGKTYTILDCIAQLDTEIYNQTDTGGNYLLLVPKALLSQIEGEVSKVLEIVSENRPLINIYHGNHKSLINAKITISTYHTFLNAYMNGIKFPLFDIVMVDECHVLRNHKTQMYTKMHKFMKTGLSRGASAYGLTGTPFVNKCQDMVNQVRLFGLVDPEFDIGDVNDINDYFYYVKKWDVLKSLPPIKQRKVIVDLNKAEIKINHAICLDFANYLQDVLLADRRPNMSFILSQITALIKTTSYAPKVFDNNAIQKFGASSKILVLKSLLTGHIDLDRQVVIFTKFRVSTQAIAYYLNKWDITVECYNGEGGQLDSFRNGDFKVLVATIQSASVGLNLQNANNVIMFDQWWNEAITRQAIDRCHRIGQTHEVNVYHLLARNTIDDKWLFKLRKSKVKVFKTLQEHGLSMARRQVKLDKESLSLLLRSVIEPTVDCTDIGMAQSINMTETIILDNLSKALKTFKERNFHGFGSPSFQSSSDECPTCLLPFSGEVHHITLGCGHRMCSGCLYDYAKSKCTNTISLSRSDIKCPICQDNDQPLFGEFNEHEFITRMALSVDTDAHVYSTVAKE